MNNMRRKQISKAINLINSGVDLLRNVLSEEDMAFNNLTDGLQQTMRGTEMEENIDILEESIDSINDALENLDNIN